MSAVRTGRTTLCARCTHVIEEFIRDGRTGWDHAWSGAAYDGGFHAAFPLTAEDLRDAEDRHAN